MKYSLWCFLFGHIFGHVEREVREGTREILSQHFAPQDYCQRCGLSKKEAGII